MTLFMAKWSWHFFLHSTNSYNLNHQDSNDFDFSPPPLIYCTNPFLPLPPPSAPWTPSHPYIPPYILTTPKSHLLIHAYLLILTSPPIYFPLFLTHPWKPTHLYFPPYTFPLPFLLIPTYPSKLNTLPYSSLNSYSSLPTPLYTSRSSLLIHAYLLLLTFPLHPTLPTYLLIITPPPP